MVVPGPRPLVICGPSGSGKSTLLQRLMNKYKDVFGFSISHTTRKPRAGEEDGREYHFVDRPYMEKAIERGEFLESAQYSGNLYGTRYISFCKVIKSHSFVHYIQGVHERTMRFT